MVKLITAVTVITKDGPKEVYVEVEAKTLGEAKAKTEQCIDMDLVEEYHIVGKYIKQITYT